MFNTYSGTSQAIVRLAKNVILLRITQNDRQFFILHLKNPVHRLAKTLDKCSLCYERQVIILNTSKII